jgi:D-alanyl-D-alanine carboxypeptidase
MTAPTDNVPRRRRRAPLAGRFHRRSISVAHRSVQRPIERGHRVLAGVVGLTLIAASCGSEDSTGSNTSATRGTEAPTATTAPVATASDTTVTEPASTAPEPTAGGAGSVGMAPPTQEMGSDDAAPIDDASTLAIESSQGELPGMWIGVWDPDKGVHLAAYGQAVVDEADATIDDKGRIGSITKTFTATAILEQVAAGALSLDDTVADVLPDLAAEAPEIAEVTVEQLLSMRSGIPEYEARVVPQILANPTEVADVHDIILSTVTEQGVTPVDDTGTYSTANYLILGEMLTALTGQPVEDVINQLAKQAGLENTALQPVDEFGMPEPASAGYVNGPAAAQLQADGIDAQPLGDVSDYSVSWGGAGGSMYSTVEDLGTWAATGFGSSFLPSDLAAQRLDSAPIDAGLDYGMGIITFPGGWNGHIGEILGWESIALYQPDSGAVFVGIVNESGSLVALLETAAAAFPELGALFGT